MEKTKQTLVVRTHHNGFVSLTARLLMLLAGALLLLSSLSLFVNPEKGWLVAVLGLANFPLLLLNLLLALWALLRWSKAVWIPLLPLLVSLLLVGRYFQVSSSGKAPTEEDIRVVTWNLGHFNQARNKSIPDRNACIDSVVRFLTECDADIILLQEVWTPDAGAIRKSLEHSFPGYGCEYYMNIDPAGSYGNVTLSRFPLAEKKKFAFPRSANLALRTDFDIRGRRLAVYNCHLESYNFALHKRDTTLISHAEQKLHSATLRRPSQVHALLDDIATLRCDALIAGDFNDPPVSYTVRQLGKGRQDTFVAAGKGFGRTWRYLPFLRIDYILCPADCKVVSHRVEKIKYSDHFPVIADFHYGKKDKE